jgi:hypothetical protein
MAQAAEHLLGCPHEVPGKQSHTLLFRARVAPESAEATRSRQRPSPPSLKPPFEPGGQGRMAQGNVGPKILRSGCGGQGR